MRQTARSFGVMVAAGVMAFGVAASPAAAHDLDSDRFRVTTRTISSDYIDVGKKGPSVGDLNIFTDRLLHRGERVGREDVRCETTRTTQRRFKQQCTATMSFRGRGQITVQGVLPFKPRRPYLVLPITGGSGIYVGAEGTIRVITEQPVRIQVRLRD